jgi:hypothetical protein
MPELLNFREVLGERGGEEVEASLGEANLMGKIM